MSGEQLLANVSIGDFTNWRAYEALYGGELVYKGWPSAERAGNVAEAADGSLFYYRCACLSSGWRMLGRGRFQRK